MSDDPRSIAQAVGAAVGEGDLLAQALGITLAEIRPGYARAVMAVRPDMSNAAGICHGGATFALADTAFAFACNSHNTLTLAQLCAITYLCAAHLGDTLTAVAEEVSLAGRSGVYDITVTNQDGARVALFRGHSRQIKGRAVTGDPIR